MEQFTNKWALILGASSGFGAATALELARAGFHIFGVHLDRKSTLPNALKVKEEIEALGRQAVFFNVNAADAEARAGVIRGIAEHTSGIYVLLHSLAFGSLKPFTGADALTKAQIDMTLDVMAHSLIYWVQDLQAANLLEEGARLFAMTSSGSTRVFPAYGAVSAAKCALESHCRQLSLELAPQKISVNAIRAGVTDTAALRKIPGNDKMMAEAARRNPRGRLTTPEDVAGAILALCHPAAGWITGNVINVDGGEEVSALL